MPIWEPKIMLRSVTGITVEILQKLCVGALILDLDNTLTTHNNPVPDSRVLEWLDRMKSAGIKLVLVSNNREKRVLPFAGELGLTYTANAMKPLTMGFKRTAKRMGLKPGSIAVVGDQLFTDIIGGNIFGSPTILVQPMQAESGPFFRLRRKIERRLLKDREYL